MSSAFDTDEWHSAKWWAHRPLEEKHYHARIPARHNHGRGFPELDERFPDVEKWVKGWTLGSSLLLSGPSGSGKTWVAVAAMYALLSSSTPPISARFVDTDDYIEAIKDSFDSNGYLPEMYSNPHLLKMIKGVFDVVVLDGLGQERQTEFAKHEIGTLLRHRHDHNLTTIVTSTLDLMEIRNIYGERVSAAILDMKQARCSFGA